jgi:hypothetical protein
MLRPGSASTAFAEPRRQGFAERLQPLGRRSPQNSGAGPRRPQPRRISARFSSVIRRPQSLTRRPFAFASARCSASLRPDVEALVARELAAVPEIWRVLIEAPSGEGPELDTL